MKKCVVIYNKFSGKKKKYNFLVSFEKILNEHDYEVKFITSNYKGHIIEIVNELDDNVDLVLSLGGDGTFNESMRGNFKRNNRLVLAHIPMGTTNDVGKMFGYEKDPLKNLEMLLDGTVRKMDICTINGEPFIYVAGFGKFMNIPYETKRKSKKKFGYLAYVFNGVKNFFGPTNLVDITFTINGEEYNGLYSFLAVTNATRIAGMKIYEDIKLDDNKFEVLLCNIKKRKDILKSLTYLRKTDITHVPGFYFYKGNNLKITFNEIQDITWCMDGEEYNIHSNEVELKIDNDTRIMMPNKNLKELFTKEKDG